MPSACSDGHFGEKGCEAAIDDLLARASPMFADRPLRRCGCYRGTGPMPSLHSRHDHGTLLRSLGNLREQRLRRSAVSFAVSPVAVFALGRFRIGVESHGRSHCAHLAPPSTLASPMYGTGVVPWLSCVGSLPAQVDGLGSLPHTYRAAFLASWLVAAELSPTALLASSPQLASRAAVAKWLLAPPRRRRHRPSAVQEERCRPKRKR